jgi:signal transduction histidine kinase
MVRNLVENAVRYASEGGSVAVTLARRGGRLTLEVYNECGPLSVANPERLFEAFYRPDAARNARTGGNGLGLAICRAVAAANCWRVSLRRERDGLRATVAF